METLTFPYGETPESVIRERWRNRSNSPGYLNVRDRMSIYRLDELLTVLDALADYGVNGGSDGLDDKYYVGRQLRISILAALGIEES